MYGFYGFYELKNNILYITRLKKQLSRERWYEIHPKHTDQWMNGGERQCDVSRKWIPRPEDFFITGDKLLSVSVSHHALSLSPSLLKFEWFNNRRVSVYKKSTNVVKRNRKIVIYFWCRLPSIDEVSYYLKWKRSHNESWRSTKRPMELVRDWLRKWSLKDTH